MINAEREAMLSNKYFRSQKLLDAAEGQPCSICDETGTTVAAHANSVALGKGTGIKCADYHVAFLCHRHHDMADGRIPLELPYASPFELWTWAYLKTVARWFNEGIVTVR